MFCVPSFSLDYGPWDFFIIISLGFLAQHYDAKDVIP